ncbi:hypothetical protein BurMR1_0933 [Burkholderia sp. MR1]|nr:hypothetical protein BurMR1_0933 [Burkholderia sp. MR1]
MNIDRLLLIMVALVTLMNSAALIIYGLEPEVRHADR